MAELYWPCCLLRWTHDAWLCLPNPHARLGFDASAAGIWKLLALRLPPPQLLTRLPPMYSWPTRKSIDQLALSWSGLRRICGGCIGMWYRSCLLPPSRQRGGVPWAVGRRASHCHNSKMRQIQGTSAMRCSSTRARMILHCLRFLHFLECLDPGNQFFRSVSTAQEIHTVSDMR